MIIRAKDAALGVLERASHSSSNYWIVLVWDVAAAAAFLAVGIAQFAGPAAAAAAIVWLGWFLWGVIEYAVHRWVLHGPFRVPARTHARHHGAPEDLIATPIFVIAACAFAIYTIVSLGVGTGAAALFVAGLYGGYNYFAIVHHLQHHHERGLGRVGYFRRQSQFHQHHHGHAGVNFGITTRVWDRVFRTYDPRAEVSLSAARGR